MVDKQPHYIFEEGTSTGIDAIPFGSFVTIKATGEAFVLADKAGMTNTTTVAAAMAMTANEKFGKSLVGPQGPQGPTGKDGSGVTIQGSDTIASILALPKTIGEMWISTTAGTDDLSQTVNIGDGIVTSGTSWITVGPIRGPQGIQGIQGIKGDAGTNGTTGTTGAAGKSAYQIALDGGFVGTEAAWLLSLNGAKGDTGPTGATGPASTVPGPTGDTGLQGPQGIQGPTGAQGIQGPAGSNATVAFASQVEVDAGTLTDKVVSPSTLKNSSHITSKIGAANYATPTVGGTVKARLSGTILYLTTTGTDA